MYKRLTMLTLGLGLVAGCTKVDTGGGMARANPFTVPHVLRYAAAEDISTLNPALNQQGTLNLLAEMTMAYLFRYDRKNRPVPELATTVPSTRNGGISADGKTITIHLRKGVTWSDGAPFDADDLVFSTNAMNNPANNITSRNGFQLVTKLDEPDKYTVVFHLRTPFSAFLPIFFTTGGAEPCILPKHILGKLSNINNAPYNALPIGIGPFKYAAWNRAQSVELVPNPGYWRGQPKLQRVSFKIIPDRNTVFAQLQSGELDLWYPTTGNLFPRVRQLRGYTWIRQPAYYYNHVDFNLTRPQLQDSAVRQALRLAIDRRTLRDKVGHGIGILQESAVPPNYPGTPKGIAQVPFSIAQANALLDGAGWKRGADGVRSKNGIRLALEYASSSGSPDVDIQLELIRGWWKQIGVEMTIKRYLASVLFNAAAQGGVLYGGKFDVVNFAWGTEAVADLAQTYSCRFIPPNGQNVTHYCNRSLEPAFDRFRSSYDEADQSRALGAIERTLVHDVPSIVTTYREDIYTVNKDLTGFHPNDVSPFDDVMNVDI